MPDAVIVGAGLGGLATAIAFRRIGWRVTVLESASVLGEVGAGIQVPPNSTRILSAWGLLDKVAAISSKPQDARSLRYEDLTPLQMTPFGNTEERYSFPYYHIHRADYHRILFNECIANTISSPVPNPGPPVKVLTSTGVVSVSENTPSVTTASQSTYTADLIVGADGVKSIVKKYVTGTPDDGQPSGDQAYRFTLPMSLVQSHPDLAWACEKRVTNVWGPDSHVVLYPIKNYELLNVVAICPDDRTAEESWTAPGTVEELQRAFAPFDPRIHKLFSLAGTVNRWQLRQRVPLPTWSLGPVCLLGDACHAMVPYAAQGAAAALEDAAGLAEALAALPVVDALKVYEQVRKPRTTKIAEGALENRRVFHMRDGEGQRERDRMVKAKWGEVSSAFDYAWAYDAVREMRNGVEAFKVAGSEPAVKL